MDKTIQAKHVPDDRIIETIRSVRGRNGVPRWATTWDILEALPDLPTAVVMAKLASMVKRGVIGGHACFTKPPYCRGDFELFGPDEEA